VKRCPRCGQLKEIEAFALCKTQRKDGRQAYCRGCQAAIYQLNREARLAKRREHYQANKATYQQRAAAWRLANPERDREMRKAAEKSWRKANADAARARTLSYRARKRSVWVEHVDPLVVLEMDDGICGICGEDVEIYRFDIDHVIPLSLGGEHSYANVQIAHPQCNKQKSSYLQDVAA
jgi:5-methylcytosine-specific restriction endonuclease McrA